MQIHLFNISERFSIPFSPNTNNIDSYSHPQICNNRIFYEAFEESTGKSHIYMYSPKEIISQRISSNDESLNSLYPNVYYYNYYQAACHDNDKNWKCTLGYISTSSPVKINPISGNLMIDASSYTVDIRIVKFPLQELIIIQSSDYVDEIYKTVLFKLNIS